ncbi:MAG: restriction endonuclease [Sediminibacterium sp.]|nr:restriction endonuclease [Sediminibacterium sp.]
MPDYDFLNLSPPEFEDLTKDILQKHLDITLESFASGRDNGIDLRYSLSPKDNLIIQCKRYKDYNSLLRNLKKEVSKVQDLLPNRYIISTSVGLTPNQKDVILALFSPYILSTSDILGRNDLNGLLTDEIEKRHFKLWLSSTNILDKILNSKIHNQSNFEEEIIKDTINVYVDNDSYYNANKIIKDKKYVIISGIPGIGKTTLARILVYHYLANGFKEFVFLSDSINEAYTIYKEGIKQIFLFDDFLGTNFLENRLSTNEEQRIIKFIERVSKSKDKIIILTTREYILAQAKQKYDTFNSPSLELAKCIIDLSQYTKIVKAKILYNHLFFSNLSEGHILDLLKEEAYKTVIQHPNYNPRIIQTITNDDIWKTIKPTDFATKFVEFIKNPKSVWKHVFENQISKLSQCILANLMTSGTPILLDELKLITQNFAKYHSTKYGITYSEIEFKKSIRELENTFIKIGKDTINQLAVEYQNPSVQDFLVYYFVEFADYIKDIIQSAIYFNQLFRIFSLEKSSLTFEISNKILLSEELKQMVLTKLINEFDFLNSTTLTGSNYSIWKKEHFSDIIKLNEIDKSLTVAEYPELREFMKAKFEILLEPIELEGKELNCYLNLLYEFYSDFEIDGLKTIKQFAENITELEEVDVLERLESIFPTEYVHIPTIVSHQSGKVSHLKVVDFWEANFC